MDAVKSARARLGRYPALLGECAPQAREYGKCVGLVLGEVRHGQCSEQFHLFMACVRTAAAKRGTRL